MYYFHSQLFLGVTACVDLQFMNINLTKFCTHIVLEFT